MELGVKLVPLGPPTAHRGWCQQRCVGLRRPHRALRGLKGAHFGGSSVPLGTKGEGELEKRAEWVLS